MKAREWYLCHSVMRKTPVVFETHADADNHGWPKEEIVLFREVTAPTEAEREVERLKAELTKHHDLNREIAKKYLRANEEITRLKEALSLARGAMRNIVSITGVVTREIQISEANDRIRTILGEA